MPTADRAANAAASKITTIFLIRFIKLLRLYNEKSARENFYLSALVCRTYFIGGFLPSLAISVFIVMFNDLLCCLFTVIARPLAGRGNPRNNGRSGLYRRTYSNLRDCFTAFAMTDFPLPSLAGKVAAKPTDEFPEGWFAVEQISHDILYYITKLFIFQLLTPPLL